MDPRGKKRCEISVSNWSVARHIHQHGQRRIETAVTAQAPACSSRLDHALTAKDLDVDAVHPIAPARQTLAASSFSFRDPLGPTLTSTPPGGPFQPKPSRR